MIVDTNQEINLPNMALCFENIGNETSLSNMFLFIINLNFLFILTIENMFNNMQYPKIWITCIISNSRNQKQILFHKLFNINK